MSERVSECVNYGGLPYHRERCPAPDTRAGSKSAGNGTLRGAATGSRAAPRHSRNRLLIGVRAAPRQRERAQPEPPGQHGRAVHAALVKAHYRVRAEPMREAKMAPRGARSTHVRGLTHHRVPHHAGKLGAHHGVHHDQLHGQLAHGAPVRRQRQSVPRSRSGSPPPLARVPYRHRRVLSWSLAYPAPSYAARA